AFPSHKRSNDEVQAATLAWGKERAKGWLKVLDQSLLGSSNSFLCGDRITIADYFAAPFLALGAVVRCDYSEYPNVRRWLSKMKGLRSWRKVNEAFDGSAASLEGTKLETL